MEVAAVGNWGDRLEIGLLFAALFGAAFIVPPAVLGQGELAPILFGVPSAVCVALGSSMVGSRPAAAAGLLLVAAPAALAVGIELGSAPLGGVAVGHELALAITAIAYFLGTGRALGGPSGKLPRGRAQPAILGTSFALVALGLVSATLADAAHYAEHYGEGAREARFLASSLALVLGSMTMLSTGPALARRPLARPRPTQQLVGRLVLYASLATVGLMLLSRIT